MIGRCQQCDTDKERAKSNGHPCQGRSGIARLRFLKSGNAIRDGFDPRHGRTTSGKGFEYEKNRQWLYSCNRGELSEDRVVLNEKRFDQANGDEQQRATYK